MSVSHQTAIVLGTMQALKSAGSWCGETHVQKALYLCQELLGVPSKFKFVLYKHGPYSFELSGHLQGLIADDFVSVQSRPPYGPSLVISDQAQSIVDQLDAVDDLAQRIKFVAGKVGRDGVATLERLATAVYVNREHGTLPPEKRAEVLVSLKPHVSLDDARSAFAEIDEIQSEASQNFEAVPPLNSAA